MSVSGATFRAESAGRSERIADERRALDHVRDAAASALRLNRAKGSWRGLSLDVAVSLVGDEAAELALAHADLVRDPSFATLSRVEREAADVAASVAILLDVVASGGEAVVERLRAAARGQAPRPGSEDDEGRLLAARQRVRTEEARVLTLARAVAASSADVVAGSLPEVVDALGASVRALERAEARVRVLRGGSDGAGHA